MKLLKQEPDFSTKKPSKELLFEIKKTLQNIKDGYGSVEIYIQDYKVVQITERNIKKTNNNNYRDNKDNNRS